MSYMSGRTIFSKLRVFFIISARLLSLLGLILNPLILAVKKCALFFRYLSFCNATKCFGRLAYISNYIVIKNPKKIKWGENLSIHDFTYIDAAGGIVIGENVSIAHNCSLVSFEHTWQDTSVPIKYNPTAYKSIWIGDDVWIGCGVRILGGTTIGNRVVVAAGSVVKGDLESGYIYGGVPAKKLKKI